MNAALLTAAAGLIGALVGAGSLWRATKSDTQASIRDLWAENRSLRGELDTERQQRADMERRVRDDMAQLRTQVERCEAEKNDLARQLADMRGT